MEFNAENFRRKLKADYDIDHRVELQILVAILLKNGYNTFSTKFLKFINYFNKSWNMKRLTKSENNKKSCNVLKYICWKFGIIKIEPPKKKNVDKEILTIFSFYEQKRTEVIKYFENEHKDYLELEESLFDFLSNKNEQYDQINIVDFIMQSKELEKKYSKLNNLDHIVELQILTYFLKINEISSFELGLKFVKYFHEDWNFRIIEKKKNVSKGQIVKKWIKLVEKNTQSYSKEICKIMKFIFDHYKNNQETVMNYIKQERGVDEREKLLNLANCLLKLLEKNISSN